MFGHFEAGDMLPIRQTYTFYGTFGTGQPGFPGYYKIHVVGLSQDAARGVAHYRMATATDNRWCRVYDSLDDLHPGDRVYRGEA